MSSEKMSFVDLVSRGDARLNQIDDFIDRWHAGGVDLELSTYLGMDADEYALWVVQPDVLELIVEARHDRKALVDLISSRRRPETESPASHRLDAWLEAQTRGRTR